MNQSRSISTSRSAGRCAGIAAAIRASAGARRQSPAMSPRSSAKSAASPPSCPRSCASRTFTGAGVPRPCWQRRRRADSRRTRHRLHPRPACRPCGRDRSADADGGGRATRSRGPESIGASIGVQSFDPKVQAAINRVQSFDTTAAAVGLLRDARNPRDQLRHRLRLAVPDGPLMPRHVGKRSGCSPTGSRCSAMPMSPRSSRTSARSTRPPCQAPPNGSSRPRPSIER